MDALVERTTPDSEKVNYRATRRCGKVELSFRTRSFDNQKIIKDNCSICIRNGYLFAYLRPEDISWKKSEDYLISYEFHKRQKAHEFCPNCRSSILMDLRESLPIPLIGINVSNLFAS